MSRRRGDNRLGKYVDVLVHRVLQKVINNMLHEAEAILKFLYWLLKFEKRNIYREMNVFH